MADQNTIRAYNALIEKQDNRLAAIRTQAKELIGQCSPDLALIIEERLSEMSFEGKGTTYAVNANMLLVLLSIALRGD